MPKLKDHQLWKETIGVYAPKKDRMPCQWDNLTKKQVRQNKRLRMEYGITLREKYSRWVWQDRRCAICHKEMELDQLCVDHDHHEYYEPMHRRRDSVRGLLCNGCNSGIGYFKENKMSMLRAIQYLEKHDTDGRICYMGECI